MKKEIKMNVIGYENIVVNTETGEISGKTYNAKDWIKRNFDAKWNKETKTWWANPEALREELTKNAKYYETYIVHEYDPEEVEDNAENEEEVKDEVKEEVREAKEENKDEIIETELVNRRDGFYARKTWKSGKITFTYMG